MHPILFDIPIPLWHETVPVSGFGAMLLVACLAATWLFGWRAGRDGFDTRRIVYLALSGYLGGLVGARLLYVLIYGHFSGTSLDLVSYWRAGLEFYGGAGGAMLVFVLYTRHFRMPALPLLDAMSPSVALAIGIGRIGCLLNGCCWGKPSELPWAIRFPAESMPWQQQVSSGLISVTAAHSLPVHPTQTYLALAGWLLLVITLGVYSRRRRHGEVAAILMVGDGVTRFVIEYLRADVQPFFHGLTVSQSISLGLVGGGLLLMLVLRHHRRPQQLMSSRDMRSGND